MNEGKPFTNYLSPGPVPLRALTIYEPFAGFIVDGKKTVEVRPQPWKFRGLLLIHTAQGTGRPGAVIGLADCYDCRPLTVADLPAALLPAMPPGRVYGLHLRDARRLPARIEWRGRQGLWEPERELRELVADALGSWGRGVAAAAERAGLRLRWRAGAWQAYPPGDPDGRFRYCLTVSVPSTPETMGVKNRPVAVHGSQHDGGRARRAFKEEEGLFIRDHDVGEKWLAAVKARRTIGVTSAERQVREDAAALGAELEREVGHGWTLREADGHRVTLPNLGDVAERLHQLKTRRETMGRITKRQVAEAAVQVGLRLSAEKTPAGEWVLTDANGEIVRADQSLASLLQHCHDHKTTLRRETAEAAEAVGLRLTAPKPEHEGAGGLWLLVDAEGETVRSDWALPPLLQHCRDHQADAAWREAAEAARAAGLYLRKPEHEHEGWALLTDAGETVCTDQSLPPLLQFCHDYQQKRSADVPAEQMAEATAQEAVVQPAQETAPAVAEREVDRLYGDGADYDRDRVTAEARHHLGQGAMAMLEAGRRLCWLREREPHGQWLDLLERIGISQPIASKMMQAARKFLGPNYELVHSLTSVTKAYELAMLDDDDLEELRKGGTAAGMTLDDIQRMTPTELRDTLRRERKEHKAREAAQRVRIESKDSHIGRLEEVSDDLHRRLDDARNPGRLTPTQAGRELLLETARVGRELEVALGNTTAVVRRLYQLSEAGRLFVEGHEMTPSALPQELVHVRAQLDAIATSAHRALGELDEQLSDPLVTAPPPPADADAGPPWGAAHRAAGGPSAQDDDE